MAVGDDITVVADAGGIRQEVRVVGFNKFRRDLKKMHSAAGKAVAWELFAIADDVVKEARKLARGQRGATGKLATVDRAFKASRKQKHASVVIGGTKKTEWALGAEFGAKQYAQFQPWRGNQWEPAKGGVGYALHPTVRRMLPEIQTRMLDAITDLSEAFSSLN